MISPLRDLEYENHPFTASSIHNSFHRDANIRSIHNSFHRDANIRQQGASSMYSTYDLEIQDD